VSSIKIPDGQRSAAVSCKNRKKPTNKVILWADVESFNVRACGIYSKHCTLKVTPRHNNSRRDVALTAKENGNCWWGESSCLNVYWRHAEIKMWQRSILSYIHSLTEITENFNNNKVLDNVSNIGRFRTKRQFLNSMCPLVWNEFLMCTVRFNLLKFSANYIRTWFDVKKRWILPENCIYVSYDAQNKQGIFTFKRINRVFFVLQKYRVYYEEGTDFFKYEYLGLD
jgi:hypothetical protein